MVGTHVSTSGIYELRVRYVGLVPLLLYDLCIGGYGPRFIAAPGWLASCKQALLLLLHVLRVVGYAVCVIALAGWSKT